MENKELYRLIDLPDEIIVRLCEYESKRSVTVSDELKDRLLRRDSWSEGIKELEALVGDDPDGIKIMWELIELVCKYSYGEYRAKGISDKIFLDTMYFFTRSLKEHYSANGRYAFKLAWWFPRLLSLNEFRIGALAYEFISDKGEISLHIHSDGSIKREDMLASLREFCLFRKEFFPEWIDARISCHTWMLAPAMAELLDEGSRLRAFMDMFDIVKTDPDATWFMGYVFPGHNEVSESLPEETSLQRRMKKHLLDGKKVGAATGYLKKTYYGDRL